MVAVKPSSFNIGGGGERWRSHRGGASAVFVVAVIPAPVRHTGAHICVAREDNNANRVGEGEKGQVWM
jgi:hypothetical protein